MRFASSVRPANKTAQPTRPARPHADSKVKRERMRNSLPPGAGRVARGALLVAVLVAGLLTHANSSSAAPAAASAPTAITFTMLTTCAQDPIEFYLNGTKLGQTTTNPTGSCTCTPPPQDFRISDSALIASAWVANGPNFVRVHKLSDNFYFSWVRATLQFGGGALTTSVYDYNGGNSFDTNLCNAEYTNSVDQTVELNLTNQDGDAWAANMDCDDTNASIGAGIMRTYYRDADGDGYGNPSDSITNCSASPPAGHVTNGNDCDDTDAGRHPGVVDCADGIDNDCDGTTDEDVVTYFRDADHDGYGDAGNSLASCGGTPPAGYVRSADDCDDSAAAVNPTAGEVADGKDNDCNGFIDDTPGSGMAAKSGYEIKLLAQGGLLSGKHLSGIAVDPSAGDVYVAADGSVIPAPPSSPCCFSGGAFTLLRITPSGSVSTVGTYNISWNEGVNLEWGPDGNIYVAGPSAVYMINPSTGAQSVFANVDLGSARHGLEFDPQGNLIWSPEAVTDFYKINPGSEGKTFLGRYQSDSTGNHGDSFGIQPNGDYVVYSDNPGAASGQPAREFRVHTANHTPGTNFGFSYLSRSDVRALGSSYVHSNGAIDPLTGDVYTSGNNAGGGSSVILVTPGAGTFATGTTTAFVVKIGNGKTGGTNWPNSDARGVTDLDFGPRTDGGAGNSLFFLDDYNDRVYEVRAENRAPAAGDDAATLNEDGGAAAVAVLANDSDPDPGSTLTITAVTQGANGSVAITGGGTGLTYQPNPNYNGADTFTYTVTDDRGATATASVAVTVTPVNDAPSFAKGADQTVNENAGAQAVGGWATALGAGPADEAAQALEFVVTNDNAALFSAQPAVAPNGTLTFTPAANANGSATVSVRLHDSGGTANGGTDTSAAQTFVIRVKPSPSFSNLSSPTITYGTASTTLSGTASAGTLVPTGEVSVTVDGVTRSAAINAADGSFSVDFPTATIPAAASPYTISYSYAGDANTAPASATGQLTVDKKPTQITLGDLTQTYDGNPKSASATTDPAGVGVSLSYSRGGQPVQAPLDAGTYDVTAAVTDANYSGTATGQLVIGKAQATVSLGALSHVYDGTAKAATATPNPSGLRVTLAYRRDGQPVESPTNGGSYEVTATVEDTNYQGAASGVLVISKAAATLTLGSLVHTYDGGAKAASASTNPAALTGVTISYARNGQPVAAPTSAGSYEVVATLTNDNYQAEDAAGTLVINKAAAALTLGSLAHTYDGTGKAATASTNPPGLTGVTVRYSKGGQPVAAPTDAGTYDVVATLANDDYQADNATGTLVINKAGATVTLSNLSHVYDGKAKSASASTDPAGKSVTITYARGAVPVTSPTDAGQYAVTASVSDPNFEGGAVGTLTIGKASSVLTWNNPAAITYGTPLGAPQLNATANTAGTFTYEPAAGTVLIAGANQTLSVSFAPADTANYEPASASVKIDVTKVGQTITFGALPNRTYGDPPFALSATASSGLAVSYQIVSGPATLSISNLRVTGVGRVTVRATQGGGNNYEPAPAVEQAFDVLAADGVITLGDLAQTYDGRPKSASVTTNPAGLSHTLTYTQGGRPVASPTAAGEYQVTAVIDDANHRGSATGTLVIGKATPVINWATPANIADGTALGAAQLNAASDVPGTFLYSPAAGAMLDVGVHQLSATFTPADAANYKAATASVQLVVGPATEALFSLGDSTYSVNENDPAGSFTVTVRRRGDLGPASVEYATGDLTTSERSDYTFAAGKLTFAAGETEKSFTVLITDDKLVEGPEDLSLTLSNPTGALSAPATATLTIVSDDAQAPTRDDNPIGGTAFFVRQLYRDFLSREPDEDGLRFWTGEIESCGADPGCREVKRVNVAAAFFLSIEFQNTGYLVYRFNQASGGEMPRYLPFLRDTRRVGQGVVVNAPGWEAKLEANKREFAEEWVRRPEFTLLYPEGTAAETFVDALNANAGGSLSPAERDSLVAGLKGGSETRATVLRKVADNEQFQRREFDKAFVLMEYFGYLRRNPDDLPDADFRGWQFWLSKLEEFHGDFVQAEMVKAFISSLEYRRRFGVN